MKSKIEKDYLEVYDKFADAIFRHCVFRVSDREKAKDLTQVAFIKLWEQMSQGKEIENIRAFLYRIVNNLIIDEYRKRKNDSLDQMHEEKDFDIGIDPRQNIEVHDDYNRTLSLIETLPDNYKEALIMRHIDDMSVKEISQITGDSENVISVRIHRAIEKLTKLAEKSKHHD